MIRKRSTFGLVCQYVDGIVKHKIITIFCIDSYFANKYKRRMNLLCEWLIAHIMNTTMPQGATSIRKSDKFEWHTLTTYSKTKSQSQLTAYL